MRNRVAVLLQKGTAACRSNLYCAVHLLFVLCKPLCFVPQPLLAQHFLSKYNSGAQEPRSSVSRSRQVGAAGAVVTGTSSPSRRPGLLPHVAFLLGCGPHVLSGTAVLLLPRNRGTAGSEVQPGGCACVLHLCCQAIVLAGTLSTAWTSCGSRFAFSKASALSLGQLRQRYGCCCLCLFCGADNTGKWLEALRLGSIALRHACYLSLQDVSLAAGFEPFLAALRSVLARCATSLAEVDFLLLPPGPPTSAFVEVPDLNLCAECALLPLRSPSPDEVEPTRLVELWSEAVLGSGCRCCIPCEPLELLLTVS